jgi:hypothetical protein
MTFGHFTIRARRDPQVLPRLLNYLAQLGEVPRRVVADIDTEVMVAIDVAGLSDHQLEIIAEKMRSSFLVTAVELSSSDQPATLPDRQHQ